MHMQRYRSSADVRVKLCSSALTSGVMAFVPSLMVPWGVIFYLSLPHLSSQERCEVTHVQICVLAERYKLKMSLTKFNTDLAMHAFGVEARLLYRKETLGLWLTFRNGFKLVYSTSQENSLVF